MKNTTSEIRVRQKHQITLPMSIIQQAHISENDKLEIIYRNGSIIMRPKKQISSSASVYAGIANGIWGHTNEEIEKNIRSLRDSWTR